MSLALTRFAALSSQLVLFGFASVALLLLRPSMDGAERSATDRLALRLEGWMRAALLAAAGATLLMLLLAMLQSARVIGTDLGLTSAGSLLGSSFGRWQLVRLPLILALAVLLPTRLGTWLWRRSDRKFVAWWSAWTLLCMALLATSSFSGHAAVASPRPLSLVNDVVHQASAGTWLTGILVLGVLLPDALDRVAIQGRVEILARTVVRFSRLAAVAIGVAALTGGLNSLLHIGALDDLVGTNYGRALLLKLAFFVTVVSLGGINHFFVRGRLQEAAAAGSEASSIRRLFRRLITGEMALGLGVVGATALLVGLARTGPTSGP